MSTPQMRLAPAIAAAAIVFVALPATACATLPAGNAIADNAGAEQGASSEDYFAANPPPSWVPSDTTVTQVRYDTVPYPTTGLLDPPQPVGDPAGNTAFFAGGDGAFDKSISQTISLTGAAAEIDTGNVAARLSAEIGGFSTQPDRADVLARFKDAGGTVLGTVTVPAVDRGGATKLMASSSGLELVPVGVRSVEVVVNFIFVGGGGASYNDGYADNLSLTFSMVEDTLIANPGAELGTSVTDEISSPAPAAWTRQSGSVTQHRYAGSGFPGAAIRDRIGGGSAFFAGGPANPFGRIVQQVDFDAATLVAITSGNTDATISAHLGGFSTENDRAEVVVTFWRNDLADQIVGTVAIPAVTATDRFNATDLVTRSATGDVPATTDYATVEVIFRRQDDASPTDYNDGYADNLRLELTNGTAPDNTAPTTTVNLTGPQHSPGTFTGVVTVSASASDGPLGSGVAATRCAVDKEPVPATFDALDPGCTQTMVTANGSHTVYAASRDNAGNKEAVVTRTFKISPALQTRSQGANGYIDDPTPEITFFTEPDQPPGTTFRCKLDNGPEETCTSPHEVPAHLVVEGLQHTFRVYSVNPDGVPDTTPSQRSFTYDGTLPSLTVARSPELELSRSPVSISVTSSDPGASPSGLVGTRCALDPQGEAPTSFAQLVDQPCPYATPQPPVSATGEHRFYAAARDQAGNERFVAQTFRVSIRPNTIISSGPDGANAPDTKTGNRTPHFFFSADPAEGGTTFRCWVDDEATAEACAPPWTTPELKDGTHMFFVRATNGEGDQDNSPASRRFSVGPPVVDTTAPTVNIGLPPPDFAHPSAPVFYSKVDIRVLTNEPGAELRCARDPNPLPTKLEQLPRGPCAYAPGGTLAGAPPTGFLTHRIYAAAKDAAGNESAMASATFILRHPPDVYINKGPGLTTTDRVSDFEFLSSRIITVGPGQLPPSPQCRVDTRPWYDCGNPIARDPCCTYRSRTDALSTGTHTFQVRARDAYGVDPTAAVYRWKIETVKPVVRRASCTNHLYWRKYGNFEGSCSPLHPGPPYPLRPIDCPVSSRCTLDTVATHTDADPFNLLRWLGQSCCGAYGQSGHSAGIYDGLATNIPSIGLTTPSNVATASCASGSPGGRKPSWTHRCTTSSRFEHVTGPSTRALVNICSGSRFGHYPRTSKDLIWLDRGPDDARFTQCITTFTIERLNSPVQDAVTGMTAANDTAILAVTAPSSGTLTVSGSYSNNLGRLSAAKKVTPPVRRTTVKVRRRGVVTVRPKLSSAARKTLRAKKKLRLTLTYAFTPTKGQGLIRSRTVTLRYRTPAPRRAIRRAPRRG